MIVSPITFHQICQKLRFKVLYSYFLKIIIGAQDIRGSDYFLAHIFFFCFMRIRLLWNFVGKGKQCEAQGLFSDQQIEIILVSTFHMVPPMIFGRVSRL